MALEKLPRIVRLDSLIDRDGVHEMIEPLDERCRKLGLAFPGVAFREHRLAVKIADFDHVAIDDRQSADPGAGKRRNDSASDAAGAHDCDARRLEPALAEDAHLRQHDVPRITVELVVGEVHRPVEPKPPAPRVVSLNAATSRNRAFSTGAGTSCAIRSPRRTSNGSDPRLARITLTSPR